MLAILVSVARVALPSSRPEHDRAESESMLTRHDCMTPVGSISIKPNTQIFSPNSKMRNQRRHVRRSPLRLGRRGIVSSPAFAEPLRPCPHLVLAAARMLGTHFDGV